MFQTTNKDIIQKNRAVMIGFNPGLADMEKRSLYEETLKNKRKRIEGDIVFGDSTQIGRYEVYPDKREVVLSCDLLYPKSQRKLNLFGYESIRSEDNSTEVYDADGTEAPTIFDLKSYHRYRHIKFSRKEKFSWENDCEDTFFVVEREYTDTMEPTSIEVMKQDYDKYYMMYPADEKTKSQLAGMEEVNHFSAL